jgi:signal transduction protein with GAF and PtsI domain
MAPARIPEVKQVVRGLTLDDAESAAATALDRDSAAQAREAPRRCWGRRAGRGPGR